jgi:hypothetical protein
VCKPIRISYLNFRAVLVLPKTVGSAQTHKSIVSFELFGALYMYISDKGFTFSLRNSA